MERRRYTREFKRGPVRLIRVRGVSYAQGSQEPFADDPQMPFPTRVRCSSHSGRLAAQREVIKLKAERDIQKAATYFRKEST
jgi:transposase-like protein